MKVKMVEQVKISLRKPLLIHGLPGLGLIGKISVEFLIDQLKPIKVLDIYSPYLTLVDGGLGVNVKRDGTFSLPKYELYAYRGKPDIIFLTGDMQPSKVGQFIIADTVLDYVEKFGCDTIIALGGYRRQTEDRDVIYTISSDPKIFKEISGVNVKVARGGSVMGAFGVILGLGKERGMNCVGLLGATSGMYPDLRASKNVLQLLSKIHNLPINLGEIESQVKNMENKFKTLSEISQIKPKKGSKLEEKKRYIS